MPILFQDIELLLLTNAFYIWVIATHLTSKFLEITKVK